MSICAVGCTFAAFARKPCNEVKIDVKEHLQELMKHTSHGGGSAWQEVFALQTLVAVDGNKQCSEFR